MNDLEASNPATPETEDLKQQCVCLQRQMTTLLLALVIISGTLTVFLWRQARYERRDLDALKPVAAQVIQEFNRNRPGLEAFVGKVAEYGKTHPDFAPIMQKYGITSSTAAPPTAVSVPAPAPKK